MQPDDNTAQLRPVVTHDPSGAENHVYARIRFEATRRLMLRAFISLAALNPPDLSDEAEATASAMRQILALTTPLPGDDPRTIQGI